MDEKTEVYGTPRVGVVYDRLTEIREVIERRDEIYAHDD